MKRRTQVTLILIVMSLIFVACAGNPETLVETQKPADYNTSETTADYTNEESAPIAEGETVEVTRIVTETVVETVIVEVEAPPMEGIVADEDSAAEVGAAAPQPMATSAPPISQSGEETIVSVPTATPQGTRPSAMFFEQYGVNPYIETSADSLSTFSLDVDTGSYNIAKRYLQDGIQPPPESVRVEEFVNSFDQGYDNPPDVGFAVYADGAPSPFHNDGTYFLRIGVQGYDIPEVERPSANLVFVIDVSGSMGQENRLGLVKESLALLVDRMRPDDTVSIVVYGTSARTVVPPTPGSDRETILGGIYSLQTEGSTNLEAGLLMGYEM
ncbi:MAG: VWA domain-containing protein, partial [Chloroflexi bacterium]|nr:VWA domain-containing protein [Chloroflexota bacterium]